MKRMTLSPVLIELLVVVLFFAICAGINVQVLAHADSLSRESERQSAALIAVTDMGERIKADPAMFCKCEENGTCSFETVNGEFTVEVIIDSTKAERGTYYEFKVSAFEEENMLAEISGGSYRKGTSS